MLLLLIRHGESEADLLGVCEGRADFPLTERGHKQVAAMAAFVKERFHVDKLYCSTLRRARQTAGHLAEAVGCEPIPVADDCKFPTDDTGIHIWRIDKEGRMILKANVAGHTAGI